MEERDALEVLQREHALQREVHARAQSSSGRGDGLILFGVGQEQIMAGLARLEKACQRSVWSVNPACAYDPEDPSLVLNERSRGRDVDVRLVTSTRAARFHPLLSSIEPEARVGPAVLKLLIIDRGTVVVEGPGTASGDSTAWVITDRSLLAEAAALWPVLWKASRPLLAPGQKPPLGQRQLEVARLMCLGHTDASIARAMNLSARSVARDIARIMTLTSSRSRPEAVLAILGRGRHART